VQVLHPAAAHAGLCYRRDKAAEAAARTSTGSAPASGNCDRARQAASGVAAVVSTARLTHLHCSAAVRCFGLGRWRRWRGLQRAAEHRQHQAERIERKLVQKFKNVSEHGDGLVASGINST
jgi:hypothetical protein